MKSKYVRRAHTVGAATALVGAATAATSANVQDPVADRQGTTESNSRRPRSRAVVSGLLAVTVSGVGLVALAAPASAASLSEVGPVDNATGFPFWFGDAGDSQEGIDPLRLELCLDDQQDALCPVVGDRPNPGAPLSVPENFPDESFWWSADALIDTPAGVKARLVLGQEAAFGGPGEVAVGQQVAFSRLRIRIDGLPAGASYHVTTPYGDRDVVADDGGRVFTSEDQGCLSTPCGFEAGLNGQVGPFLRWDSGAPEGYVGDPAVEHTVVGSPTHDNFFRVEGPDIGGPGVDVIETNLFAVQGRIAQPRATVDLPGDLYEVGTPVEITSSFPGESEIVYTSDGSDPRESETATVHTSTDDEPDATVTLPAEDGAMTLKYVVRHEGQTSQVYTQEYTVRAHVSIVSATPGPAVAPEVLEGRHDVVLTAATSEGPTDGAIFYTTDGTRPSLDEDGEPVGSTHEYSEPIPVTRTTVVKAVSLPDATETAPSPQPGPVARFRYVIHNLRAVSTDKPYGFPDTLTDIGLAAGPGEPRTDPVELELCLDDPLCPVVGELPDPTRGISFPDNFPDESFWWSGEAGFTAAGIDARLVLGEEAAFDSPTVQDGHQVAFGRIRVRLRDAVPGATYKLVHPYGVVRATADDRGRLFYTDDNGCMNGPCGFDKLLTQPVGPFLRWDSGAPAGYVGDPNVEHTVTGSPYGTNEFTVSQVTDGNGRPISSRKIGSTNLFTVQGKLAGPGVIANWQTGTFGHDLQVTLTGNSRTDEIRYTLDGTTPTATTGQVYDGPIHVVEGTTVLNYVGVGHDGVTSTMESETFTIDTTAPTLDASPAGGEFNSARNVTLTTDDPTASIRYTTNGSKPTADGTLYRPGTVIRVDNTLTLKAIATDPLGNSTTRSWDYTIDTTAPILSASPAGGEFNAAQRVTLTPDEAATIRYTLDGSQPNASSPVYAAGEAILVDHTSRLTAVATDRVGNKSTTSWSYTITPPRTDVVPTPGFLLAGSTVSTVKVGGATTLSGALVIDGRAVSGAAVVLQSRPVTTTGIPLTQTWAKEPVATMTTAGDGSFAFAGLRADTTNEYRAVFTGDPRGPIVSASQVVSVRAVVSLAKPDRRVASGDKVRFHGKLGATLIGERVVVTLDGPGRHTKQVSARVNAAGTWRTAAVRAPGTPGAWKAVAAWRGNDVLLGDQSATRAFRVVR